MAIDYPWTGKSNHMFYLPYKARALFASFRAIARLGKENDILNKCRIGSAGPLLLSIVLAAQAHVVTITPSKDNTLYQDATGSLSNGKGDGFFVGQKSSGAFARRAVLAFDVSDVIPPGSEIHSVSLTLHVSRTTSGPQEVALHKLHADWGEGDSLAGRGGGGGAPASEDDATWLHRFFDSDMGTIEIDGVGTFEFDPANVTTARPDIFKPGHFSVFDILVYLDEQGLIDLDFRFVPEMNTHVIDTINGLEDWWYVAHYDGGWFENNVFRMDHFPYKDKMFIRLLEPENPAMVEAVHTGFGEEVERRQQNDGRVIIPSVVIRGQTFEEQFENVEVTAHNLRDDTFQDGVITAIDIILSLADHGTWCPLWLSERSRPRQSRGGSGHSLVPCLRSWTILTSSLAYGSPMTFWDN